MSRGGRGGARGGGFMSSSSKLNSGNIPFDIDADVDDAYDKLVKNAETFPENKLVIAEPVTDHERRHIARYRSIRAKIHAGPFYLPLDPNIRVNKSGKRSNPASRFNPFEDAPTWSTKHSRKPRGLPKLTNFPFAKEFFPKELWPIIGVDEENDDVSRKKKLALSTKARLDKLAKFDEVGDENGVGAEAIDEENPANEDKDEAEVEELQDDEFEEDEDDLGDDYNAEQYFDGGEDDYDDMGGGDDGGDEGY